MRIRAAIAATLTGAALLAGLAPTASAAPAAEVGTRTAAGSVPGFFTADGVQIRLGPGTNRTSIGAGYRNQNVSIHCDTHNGWYRLTNQATGVTGWSYWPKNILIRNGVGYPPNC